MILNNLRNFFFLSLNRLDRCVASWLAWLIMQGRPFLGAMDVCPFTIGCTNFALITLENYIVPVATLIIIKRLLLCNPISILVLSYAKK